jgi:hypothetical protein
MRPPPRARQRGPGSHLSAGHRRHAPERGEIAYPSAANSGADRPCWRGTSRPIPPRRRAPLAGPSRTGHSHQRVPRARAAVRSPPAGSAAISAARSDNAEQRRLPLLRLHAEASVFLMHQQLTSAVRTGPESLVLAKPLALRRLPPPATVSVNIDCGHRSAGVSEPSLGAAGP